MKKKILLIGVFALLVLSRTFAGQYVYKEASRDRGLVSAYVRFCAKSFKDDAATSESINVTVEALLKSHEEASNITGCFLSSNTTYVILKEEVWVIGFSWEPYQRWGVFLSKKSLTLVKLINRFIIQVLNIGHTTIYMSCIKSSAISI